MGKKRAHILFGAIAGAVLLAFLVLVVSLRSQVGDLRRQLDELPARLEHDVGSSVRNVLYGVEDRLTGRLEAGSSFLSSQQAAVRYSNGQLRITLTLSPKTLEPGEEVFLLLDGMEEPVSASSKNGISFTATLESELRERITPTVLFIGEDGSLRQEELKVIETEQLLSVDAASCWAGDLYNWPGPKSAFYLCISTPPEELAKLELVLRNADGGGEVARFQMEPVDDFPRDQFPEGMIAYGTDLGEWRDREGSYGLWAELTTTGGLLLTNGNEVGSFTNQHPTDGSRSSGTNVLSPVWSTK